VHGNKLKYTKGQSVMGNPETSTTLGTQDRGQRKKNTTKKMSNTDTHQKNGKSCALDCIY